MPLTRVAPTPGVAWVATKAPGGAYHKNLFHQLEHVYCFLRKAVYSGRAPEAILWPYATMPLTRALVAALLPGTRWHETCCGRDKVAARWWKGAREPCSCWQKVCTARFSAFWPDGAAGRAAHRAIRDAAHAHCALRRRVPPSAGPRGVVVRLLERPWGSARQWDERSLLLETLREAAGGVAGGVRGVTVETRRLAAKLEANGTALAPGSRLCDQLGWFAGAAVLVTPHGAANALSPFADAGTLVVEVLPYAYKPESPVPTNFIEALLANTDIAYMELRSALPLAPPAKVNAASSHGHGARAASAKAPDHLNHPLSQDESACREDKACRLAFRDAAGLRLDAPSRQQLRSAIASRTLWAPGCSIRTHERRHTE